MKASFDGLLTVLEAVGAKTAETAKTLPADKEEGFARLDALTRIGNAVFTTDMLGAKNAPGFDPWKNCALDHGSGQVPAHVEHVVVRLGAV